MIWSSQRSETGARGVKRGRRREGRVKEIEREREKGGKKGERNGRERIGLRDSHYN